MKVYIFLNNRCTIKSCLNLIMSLYSVEIIKEKKEKFACCSQLKIDHNYESNIISSMNKPKKILFLFLRSENCW